MAPTITLTGSFKDLLGNAVTSGTVTAVLMGYGADIPRVAGTAIFDLTQLSASVSGSGTFTLGPFYGNDVITPGPLTTYYQITMPAPVSSGASGGTVTKNYQFSGSGSFDLSQLVPMGTPQRGDNTLANAAIPQVFSPVSHQFLTGMNSLGQLSSAQPSASDLSDGTTGAGAVVRATSPTLTTPIIVNGTISAASGTAVSWNSDTGLSRDASGVVDVGNGTAGDTSGNLQFNKITKYAGVSTVANGVPALVAKYDATAQAANIASTLLYAVPASAGGFYRVSFYEVVTQAATTSSALPGFFVSATDNDTNVAYSSTVIGASTNGSGNTVGVTNSFTSGSGINNAVLNLKGGTNLNFLTSNYASTGATPMQYAIHVKLEYLG